MGAFKKVWRLGKVVMTLMAAVCFLLTLAIVALVLVGCKSDTIVRHPDAPVLITEVVGRPKVRASTYSEQEGQLVDIGVIDIPPGWTLSKFDWAAYVEKKKKGH